MSDGDVDMEDLEDLEDAWEESDPRTQIRARRFGLRTVVNPVTWSSWVVEPEDSFRRDMTEWLATGESWSTFPLPFAGPSQTWFTWLWNQRVSGATWTWWLQHDPLDPRHRRQLANNVLTQWQTNPTLAAEALEALLVSGQGEWTEEDGRVLFWWACQAGADPDAFDRLHRYVPWNPQHRFSGTGNTWLHHTVRQNAWPVTEWFLNHGVDPDAVNDEGKSPGDLPQQDFGGNWQAWLDDHAPCGLR